MKITLDIHDELLARAKCQAKVQGRSLHALVEDGLRLVLEPPRARRRYSAPDLREGDLHASDRLERYSWPELRELIYGDPSTR
ncbi:MAG: DUF2191 domain-containing protein [Gammaproteobacteria bacterium]|nr:DUF2191 domain-containing protein [Gammaproteobacteria bacterium]MXW46190.1 DUF2191 domain-containing protein [Gammaproteobacteria bacterium]MYD02096.1 DUF2191 domain-containing protein [Gammaproteobacteria bacterium]MYI24083.1 DUF2191 domain-containing protein [Gammaproteobacteria bacterium]